MLTKKTIEELAFLTMLADLGRTIAATSSPGRFKARAVALEKGALHQIDTFAPRMTTGDVSRVAMFKIRFARDCGLEGKPLHVATHISMLTTLIADRMQKFEKLAKPLWEMFEHYDRANKAPAPSVWSGELAAEKWKICVDKYLGGVI